MRDGMSGGDCEGLHPDGGSGSACDGSRAFSLASSGARHLQASGARRTRLGRRLVAALCLVVGGLALWGSAPALALIHRGHTFSFAIEGTKGEKLSKPSGVAVNESTGDVYVVDAGNSRVERFSATGSFIAAWGWGVTDGKAEYEVCTNACKAGLAGTGPAQFNSPEAIAIDETTGPSGGDVYVVSDTLSVPNVIEKFSSTGVSLGRLKTEGIFGIGGVGVDASGVLWIWEHEEGRIDSFTGALENKLSSQIPIEESAAAACGSPGFAVDAGGEAFYVAHRLENFEEECLEGANATAVAAKVHIVGEPPVGAVLIQGLDSEKTTAIAVDMSTGAQASGDVYVDNVTGIAAFTSAGELIQRFGAEAELTKGRGVAVDAQRGEVLVADAGKGRVDVFGAAPAGAPMIDSVSSQNLTPESTRLEARIDANGIDTHYYFQYGTADCKATPAACTDVPLPPPGADIGSGFGDVAVSVTLTGLQSGTTYFYRVVAENENGEQAEGAQVSDSFTTLPNPVGLLPDGREWEIVSPPEKAGAGIEALGGAVGAQGGIMEASEDGNAMTYVADAPVESEPEGSRSPEGTQVLSNRSSTAWSSKDIVTPSNKGEGLSTGQPQEYQLFSADLAFALLQPFGLTGMQEPPLVPGVQQEERGIYRRSNATCQAIPTTCYQPIVTAENNTAEVKENFGGKIGIIEGSGLISGTSDLSHVVFQSEVALTGPKPKPSELLAPRLYEWSAASAPSEQLQLVSVLPDGTLPKGQPWLGRDLPTPNGANTRTAISADGSRIVWSGQYEGKNEETTRLYVRDMTKKQTMQVNLPAPGVKLSKIEEEETEVVHFQFASSDGSRVFFTDTAALTAESQLSPAREGPADLYVCDLIEVGGELKCELTDLTVDPRSGFGETADVVGVVLGGSEDGSSVYFVANGVLSAEAASRGAKDGNCSRPTAQEESAEAECNLYLERYNAESGEWEEPRYIATLSQEDFPDWEGDGGGSLGGLTARVSPNGHHLAFMSNRSLTGYDNVDASEAAGGARDEEVFLYDSETRRLVCASCNPSGARPHGVLDTANAGEGLGLVVDRPGIWRAKGPRWIAGSIPGWTPLEPNSAPYQSRYLNDEGRLFFNGADALVAQDVNGKEDVYQFEPANVGDCNASSGCVALISSGTSSNESGFLDASVSGNDVFFVTAAQLVSTDRDNSFDVYDARVCGSSPCIKPPPPPPPPCGSEATCRPSAPPPSVFEAPASATSSGAGNIPRQETLGTGDSKPKPLTKAQKLVKAMKVCKKKFKHAKKKRASCETQARRAYGPKKAHKHKAGKKK
jgi:DNA-binding beta-propeller fold protein YncE